MSNVTYLCNGKTTTGDSEILDIRGAYQERVPPVLHVSVTGSVNYTVYGSHDMADWQPYLSSQTAGARRDFVVGVRFWKITVNSNSGSITASVGEVPDRNGQIMLPSLYTPNVSPVP